MAERTLNFGADATDAKYQIEDSGDPGDFVLARDTDGSVVLLQWNDTAGAWEYGGPVDLDGNDLTDAGTTVYDASADTVGDGTTSADHTSIESDHINTDRYIEPGDGDPFSIINTYISNNAQNAYKFVLSPGEFATTTTLNVGEAVTNLVNFTPVFIEGYGGQEDATDGTYVDCSGLGAATPAIYANGSTPKNYVHLKDFALSDTELSSYAIEADSGLSNWVVDGMAFDGFDVQIRTHAQVTRSELHDVFSRDGQFIHASHDVGGAAGWNVIDTRGLQFQNNAAPVFHFDGISMQSVRFRGGAAHCDGVFWRQDGSPGTSRGVTHRWHFENMNATSGTPLFDVGGDGVILHLTFSDMDEAGTTGANFLDVGTNATVSFLKFEDCYIANEVAQVLSISGTVSNLHVQNSNIRAPTDMTNVGSTVWENVARSGGSTYTWPSGPSELHESGSGQRWKAYEPRSSTPTAEVAGVVYLDDGSNTGSGNYGLRVYNGTSFVDL